MYPVLKIMHMLNFLDTFSMGITAFLRIILFNGIIESDKVSSKQVFLLYVVYTIIVVNFG